MTVLAARGIRKSYGGREVVAGIDIPLTTHFMDEAERLCDRLKIIDHGRTLCTRAELHGETVFCYLRDAAPAVEARVHFA